MSRLSVPLGCVLLAGCIKPSGKGDSGDTGQSAPSAECVEQTGCILAEELAYGLLSVQARADNDIWVVGSSPDPADGTGPAILHYNNDTWTKLDTSRWAGAEIWWAWIQEEEAIFVGDQGLILQLSRPDGRLEQIEGPEEGTTFYGVWGANPDDVWAVGQTDYAAGPRALWRRQGGTWTAWEDETLGVGDDGVIYFKVHGTAANDVWMVGSRGVSVHWDGSKLTEVATNTEVDTTNGPILTVDADPEHPVAVGGQGNGLLLEYDGTAWRDRSPPFQPSLNGVCSGAGQQWAVGQNGSRSRRAADGTWTSDMDLGHSPPTFYDWHGCDVTPSGTMWSVGGRISSRPLTKGIIGVQGDKRPPALPD